MLVIQNRFHFLAGKQDEADQYWLENMVMDKKEMWFIRFQNQSATVLLCLKHPSSQLSTEDPCQTEIIPVCGWPGKCCKQFSIWSWLGRKACRYEIARVESCIKRHKYWLKYFGKWEVLICWLMSNVKGQLLSKIIISCWYLDEHAFVNCVYWSLS